MPLFMDRHDISGVTAEQAAEGHVKDLAIQDRYGVRFLTYWFDPDRATTFCLADAPAREHVELVHREAHGMIPAEVIEVDGRAVEAFLGRVVEPEPGVAWVETAFRTVLFTDIAESTAQTQALGDAGAMRLLRAHDRIVRSALETHAGSEVKHTGDGIMASFGSVTRAVECSIAIQRRLDATAAEGLPVRVRIGMAAGEPVTEGADLFGATVQLAARLCSTADPGGILATSAIRELTTGKGFRFEPRGELELRGFPEPVGVVQIRWDATPG